MDVGVVDCAKRDTPPPNTKEKVRARQQEAMKLPICFAAVLLFFTRTACCLSVEPRDELYAKTGSTVTLTCSVGGLENGTVTWMKGDIGSSVRVNSLNDSRISTESNSLTITNYHNSEHGGSYYCAAQGPDNHHQLSCPTHVQHAKILVNNASVPVVTRVVSVVVNSTAAFVCDVPTSWPPAVIYWERDDVRLDVESDPRFSLLPSGNLYITAVTEQDQAMYRCFTTNPVTTTTRHSKVIYQLTITAPPASSTAPTFSIAPVDTIAIAGSSVVIECLGDAHPTPDLEWIIIHDTHFPKEGGVLPTGGLQFDPVTSEDAGRYRCLLSNSAGSIYATISLVVKEPPSLSSAPQPRLQLPVDGAVATNNTIITCAASGSPPLEVMLSHDGHVIRAGNLSEGSRESEVVLTHPVTEEGYYQCFASNDYGCEQWTTLATFATSLPTTTEPPTEERSTDPFNETPSNLSTTTQRIFTTIGEALATTEAPFSNGSSEGEQTSTQGEPITITNEEGPTTTSQGGSTTTIEGGPTTNEGGSISTTREVEPAISASEGEPMTSSEGPTTGEGEVKTTNIDGVTSRPTEDPVSERVTATINSQPVTDSTSPGTATTTMDMPTDSALTTPFSPPLMLDVMTNDDSFTVMLGSSLTLECHVTGGGAGTTLSWLFNGVKLPDVGMAQQNINDDGVPQLASRLTFDLVEASDAGVYECEAHSPVTLQTVRAPIEVNVQPLLQAPLNVTLFSNSAGFGRLAISWLPNPLNEGHLISGYKIIWATPSRLVQSAVASVEASNMQYTTDPIDLSVEYGVLVWAYSPAGDGLPAETVWTPVKSPVSTTEARTECIATVTSPTQVLLEWPEQMGTPENERSIVATCQASQTSSVTLVPMATNSYTLGHLLPSCRYHFRVGMANCYVDTPPGNVGLGARVHRHDNGSIRLDWLLPVELRDEATAESLTIDVRVGGANSEWVPIEAGHTPHIPAHLLSMEHTIEFRLRLGNWEGHSLITIPPQTTPTATTVAMESSQPESGGRGFQFNEIGLIYGVIFGVLVVACVSVVIVILILKYIQMNRREDDKATNHREKHMEEFRRLSLKRSSVNSMKKDPNY